MHAPVMSEINDPGPLRASGGLKGGLLGVGVIALIAGFALAYSHDPATAFGILLVQYCFYFFISLAGLFFTALHYTAGAKWSTPIRRVAEGLASFFPISVVLLVGILLGAGYLYDWAPANADYPYHGSFKDMYLSTPAFWFRTLGFVALCFAFKHWIIGGSLKQDQSKDPEIYTRNVTRSILFLIVFGMGFTLFTMDILMSLQAKFFSTMFGIYCFAGMFLSGISVITLLTMNFRRLGYLAPFVRYMHMRDLGTWLMGFATFMMYVGFSQYMLIWYANMPDETFYFMQRSAKGWGAVFVLLPLLKWIVPFFVLMPNSMRTNPKAVIFVCTSILVGQYIDIYWMVIPTLFESFRIPGIADILMFIGVGGLFGFSIMSFYEKHSLLALGDPYLLAAVNGEHLH